MIPPAALDSLYGPAHGGAFGDRWFFTSREEREGAIAHRITPGDVPWYWTDDTAQALAPFGHLAANGVSVRQDALAAGLAGAYAADPYREYGPSMHDVLRRIGATTCAIAARTGVADLPPTWRAALEPLTGWVPAPPGGPAWRRRPARS
ncbi:ADP-ribosylglycohydrolase family protein [Actinacidiphila sp. bgisy160]|uniref:ADP-ribosylglycohydrolase family protein n=1 Tax=Actinacidiphila sp. bgisy160 TaxID=3413796 RepID=UPI003D73CAC0